MAMGQTLSSDHLVVAWTPAGQNQDLKTWSVHELSDGTQFKHFVSQEKDPVTGKMTRWQGVLLSQVIEKVLNHLPLENRAQVDLVVLRNDLGARALIPRALVIKYPILLALQAKTVSSAQDGRGAICSIVPWSSKPRILHEDLPLESFFVPKLTRIELTSYKDQYGSLFLRRRTDPSAMRGEKLFVQNCVSCHAVGQGPTNPGITLQDEKKEKQFAQNGHPAVNVKLKLSERDRKSIVRYLDAHRMENPVSVTRLIRSVQANPGVSQENSPRKN
jgi:hypothetical protein